MTISSHSSSISNLHISSSAVFDSTFDAEWIVLSSKRMEKRASNLKKMKITNVESKRICTFAAVKPIRQSDMDDYHQRNNMN